MNGYTLSKEAINPCKTTLENVEKGQAFLIGGSLFVRSNSFSARGRDLICCNNVIGTNSIQLPETTEVVLVTITILVEEVES